MKKSVYLMVFLLLLLMTLLAGAFGCDDDDDDCPRCPADDDDADDDAIDDDDDDTTDDDTTDDDTTDDDTTDDDTTDDDTTDDDTTDDDTTDDDTTDDDTTDDDTTDDDTTDDDTIDDDTGDDDTTDDDTGDDDTTLHEPEGVPVTGAVTVNGTPITTYFAAYNQADVLLKIWKESKGVSFLANVDPDGSYRAPYVEADTYNIEIEILVYDGEDFSWTYRNSYIVEDLVVGTEPVVQNIALTLYTVSGAITDPDSGPITGTMLEITGEAAKDSPTAFDFHSELTMAADTYSIFLPAFDAYVFRYSPPLATSLPQASESPVVVTADMTHDFQFTVTGYETRVKLTNDGTSWYYDLGLGASGSMTFTGGGNSYTAEFEGGYSYVDIVLPAGAYDVVIDYRSISYNVYQYTKYFDDTQQITVTAPKKDNVLIEVPLIDVTGAITDPEGVALEDVLVKAVSVADGATFTAYNYTDETGVYNLLLPAGAYDLYYDAYYEDDLVPEREAGVVVTEALTHDYQFVGSFATLEGTITINDMTPLLFFSSLFVFGDLYLIDQYGVEYYGMMDSDGSYSINALPGSYTVYLSLDAIIGFSTYFFYEDEEFGVITLSDDEQTQDFNLTMYHLSGNVYMSDAVTPAVPTTIMATNSQEHITDSSDQSEPFMYIISEIWDAQGYYSIPLSEGLMNMALINVNDHLEYCNNILVEDDLELDFVFAWDGETK